MQNNIEETIKNNIKVEEISKSTEELVELSNTFRKQSTGLKIKICWKNWRMKILFASFIIILLVIIITISIKNK
jgi:hypothetical protein